MWYTLSKKIQQQNNKGIKMMTIKYVTYILLLMELMAYTNGFSQFDLTKTKCVEDNNETFTCNFIPNSLPVGVTTVHLNLSLMGNMYLNKSTFIDYSWNKVKLLEINADLQTREGHLILKDYCFNGLKELKELRLHVDCSFYMNPNTFISVKDVGVLDFSRSVRFTLKNLIPALNGSDKLPELNKLILSNCSRDSPLFIDDQLMEVLQSKKIYYLDVSRTDITINFTAVFKRLAFLEVLDASYSNIGFFISTHLEQGDMKRIKFLDLSFVNLPKKAFHLPPGRLVIENINTSFSKLSHPEDFKLFLTPEIVNASGIFPHFSSIWIKSVNFTVDVNPSTFTKELIIRQNNLRWLDVNVICENFKFSSFSRMDLSENGMQFLHPNILSCFPNLHTLDLSSNELVKMSRGSLGLFETLFSGLRYLKNINMSKNSLNKLPMKIFENNRNIEIIDLSGNILDQVHITLTELSRLSVLNLYGNNIHVLDQMSIYNLNSISNGNATDIGKNIVILKANPISCSECKEQELSFLVWLTSTNLVDLGSQQLICYNEKDEAEIITQETVKKVKLICQRKVTIIATSVLAGCISLIIIISLLIFYHRRKHRKRLQNRANVINMLRQGDGNYEFAVFLAFSNEDEDFVNTHILHQLNENLQLMTGVDRELVCTGDRHFRPGFYVQNETCRRLATASVLIVVASENFCQSIYCRGELEQAFMEGKPIILMFIEQVEQELMPPTMREVYQRNVRIVWTLENGEYKMKTTWENVCKSVLDLMK